jgi:2'-hydroxyisoflavone reductase
MTPSTSFTSKDPLKILVLGGTRFLGRHITNAAIAQGHQVTLFNRGIANPELFPQVEHLRGDRDGSMAVLAGRSWDVVIDTCGYVPRIVQQGLTLLRGQVGRYVYISSISAYADLSQPGTDESSPLAVLNDDCLTLSDWI